MHGAAGGSGDGPSGGGGSKRQAPGSQAPDQTESGSERPYKRPRDGRAASDVGEAVKRSATHTEASQKRARTAEERAVSVRAPKRGADADWCMAWVSV